MSDEDNYADAAENVYHGSFIRGRVSRPRPIPNILVGTPHSATSRSTLSRRCRPPRRAGRPKGATSSPTGRTSPAGMRGVCIRRVPRVPAPRSRRGARFHAPPALFHLSFLGLEASGSTRRRAWHCIAGARAPLLTAHKYNSIFKCDFDIWRDLYRKDVLSSGTMMYLGIADHMQKARPHSRPCTRRAAPHVHPHHRYTSLRLPSYSQRRHRGQYLLHNSYTAYTCCLLSEHVNQEVEQFLHLFVNQRQDDWYAWISLAEFAYNNQVHALTQASPFMLDTGQNQ